MTVVVTVIALVIGGILFGRSLLRSAELQSMISDVNRFKQAAELFRDKYKYMPGDFLDGERFWGAAAGCPNSPLSAAPAKATCNGNGDGFIGGMDSDNPSTVLYIGGGAGVEGAKAMREPVRLWQHLANAGLIESAYSGTGTPDVGDGWEPGLNLPKGAMPRSGYTFHYAKPEGSTGFFAPVGYFPAQYNHVIVFGSVQCPPGLFNVGYEKCARQFDTPARSGALTPSDALSIDQKADDGKPGSGAILTYGTEDVVIGEPVLACATTTSSETAAYAVSETRPVCALIFITGF